MLTSSFVDLIALNLIITIQVFCWAIIIINKLFTEKTFQLSFLSCLIAYKIVSFGAPLYCVVKFLFLILRPTLLLGAPQTSNMCCDKVDFNSRTTLLIKVITISLSRRSQDFDGQLIYWSPKLLVLIMKR